MQWSRKKIYIGVIIYSMGIESSLSLNVVVMYKGTAKYSLGTNSKLFVFQQNVFVCHKMLEHLQESFIPFFFFLFFYFIHKLLDISTKSIIKSFIHYIPKHTLKHHVNSESNCWQSTFQYYTRSTQHSILSINKTRKKMNKPFSPLTAGNLLFSITSCL